MRQQASGWRGAKAALVRLVTLALVWLGLAGPSVAGRISGDETAQIRPVDAEASKAGAEPAQSPAASAASEPQPSATDPDAAAADAEPAAEPFRLGEIVFVLGRDPGQPGIGGASLSREQIWLFDRPRLDQAVHLVPGVVSSGDANGRRNEADVLVRGFGRWQVPLLVDGVRIYLPADNRIDFARFLTPDVETIQVQKGHASILDGPGAMGGLINLVTRKPARRFEAEAGVAAAVHGADGGWDGYLLVGGRQSRSYVQGSVAGSAVDAWWLPASYRPATGSLQPPGRRLGADASDWRVNVKAGFTPTSANEYVVNYTRQSGEKGAPLNVYNNPPVPPNSYWRWPRWEVQSLSLLTTTQLRPAAYLKAKAYYNTFDNVLDAYDDLSYTTQSAPGRFRSTYADRGYGTSVELGVTSRTASTTKAAVHYRRDEHREQQVLRPTHPTAALVEPWQRQSQHIWSLGVEHTMRPRASWEVVGAVGYEASRVDRAEDFSITRGLFTYPTGGTGALVWQAAIVWRDSRVGDWHASVSDRSRFPVLLELYSTRLGLATPNPDLGPERATNLEVGWSRRSASGRSVSAALFLSDLRDMIQAVVLPDSTTQSENVGGGTHAGLELSVEVPLGATLRAAGHYTWLHRRVRDPLRPDLRPTGTPTHRGFAHLTWRPVPWLRLTPSLDVAGDRWSDVMPPTPRPFVRTGAYRLLGVDAAAEVSRRLEVTVTCRNLLDDYFELARGFPQPGRACSVRTRVKY